MTAAEHNKVLRSAIRVANYNTIKHRDAAGKAHGDEQRGRARAAEQVCLDIVDELTRLLKREVK